MKFTIKTVQWIFGGIGATIIGIILEQSFFSKKELPQTSFENTVHENNGGQVIGNLNTQNNYYVGTSTPSNFPVKETTPSKQSKFKSESEVGKISGRLTDRNGNPIALGTIRAKSGEKVLTDSSGFFSLKLNKLDESQVKVFITFQKEGIGQNGRYVGAEQQNIILKL